MSSVQVSSLVVKANQIFTPGYPVRERDLFAGRTAPLKRTLEALIAPGRHPIVFGQRGVGKTSLANILGQQVQGVLAVGISCDGSDNFASIWNRVLATASIEFRQQAFGFQTGTTRKTASLGALLGHDPSTTKPAELAALIRKVQQYCVVVLDEFDKVADQTTKSQFADLLKIVSDTVPNFTIVLVGVADNVHELIGEHRSLDRNLVQIELPLMNDQEIRDIFYGGLSRLNLTVENSVIDQVALLAGGFPHYAHLLGLSTVKACENFSTSHINDPVFDMGCNIAVQDVIEKLRDSFAKASATTQLSRYPLILSACGYATTDTRGVFRASDVTEAIWKVFNESLPVQAVVPALGDFTHAKRGSVLRAVNVAGRQRYRFSDPMMMPFCRLKARELLLARSGRD